MYESLNCLHQVGLTQSYHTLNMDRLVQSERDNLQLWRDEVTVTSLYIF